MVYFVGALFLIGILSAFGVNVFVIPVVGFLALLLGKVGLFLIIGGSILLLINALCGDSSNEKDINNKY